MKRMIIAAGVASLVLAACTSTGVGEGVSRNGTVTAEFGWKEKSASGGSMIAKLSTGAVFVGEYFQVTQTASIDSYTPLWTGWEPPRGRRPPGEWDNWGPHTGFVTTYTGKVLVNLAGPDSTHMRCRFTLRAPFSGMSEGGQGRCQLSSGEVIDASFSSK
jgi:predicted small secreted protein